MVWPQHIERWRRYVVWESKDIPTDLVLSIIRHESRGKAGEISNAKTPPGKMISDNGDEIVYNRATGLMQVIPSNVERWNEKKKPIVTIEDMRGDDERAVRLQIRLGSSIFAGAVHAIHRFDPRLFPGTTPGTATAQQLQLALVAYAIGAGKIGGKRGLIPKLEILRSEGKPLTLDALRKRFPKWGYSEKKQRWINRPVQSAMAKWVTFTKHATGATSKAISTAKPIPLPGGDKWFSTWMIPALIMGFVLFMERKALTKLFK